MLKFCLTVDCEGVETLKQISPRWNTIDKIKGKINYALRNIRYNKDGFKLVYNEIKNQKFPCTFMLVGKKYKPIEKLSFIEWGYHSLNHLPLTLISKEKLENEVKNIYNVKSFTAPLWMIEDISNPLRVFKVLKKNKYKFVVYKGKDDGIKHFHKLEITKPEIKYGIKLVHLSNCFEGNSSKEHIEKIKMEILENINKDAVYLLSTHDFTHKNNKNLRIIISFIKHLQTQGKIKAIKLSEA